MFINANQGDQTKVRILGKFQKSDVQKIGVKCNFLQDVFTKRECPELNGYCTSVNCHQVHAIRTKAIFHETLFHLSSADPTAM